LGPEGTVRGREALRDWLGRTSAPLKTLRAFVRGETVVLAQQAIASSQGTGGGEIASCYEVSEGQVVHFACYEGLEAALVDAGLDASDEMKAF
jgi:hypothetical protein